HDRCLGRRRSEPRAARTDGAGRRQRSNHNGLAGRRSPPAVATDDRAAAPGCSVDSCRTLTFMTAVHPPNLLIDGVSHEPLDFRNPRRWRAAALRGMRRDDGYRTVIHRRLGTDCRAGTTAASSGCASNGCATAGRSADCTGASARASRARADARTRAAETGARYRADADAGADARAARDGATAGAACTDGPGSASSNDAAAEHDAARADAGTHPHPGAAAGGQAAADSHAGAAAADSAAAARPDAGAAAVPRRHTAAGHTDASGYTDAHRRRAAARDHADTAADPRGDGAGARVAPVSWSVRTGSPTQPRGRSIAVRAALHQPGPPAGRHVAGALMLFHRIVPYVLMPLTVVALLPGIAAAQTAAADTGLSPRQVLIKITNAAGAGSGASNIGEAIADLVGLEVSTAPIGSSAGGFTFTFDPATRSFMRAAPSFGPMFGDRAITAGEGRAGVGVNFIHATYDALDGIPIDDGSLRTVIFHGGPSAPAGVATLTITSDTLVMFANLSLNRWFDASIAAPWVTLRLDGTHVIAG